jgi:hypothetical protein
LEYAQGALHEVGHLGGFVRAVEHADDKRQLLWQDAAMSRELRIRQPETVIFKNKKFTDDQPLKLARSLNNDQLFGYTWGDWDGDGAEDFAFLQSGERLRILFGAKDAKWSSDEVYGGTKADFDWDDGQTGSLYPRLMNYKPASGKMQLLVPHNISATPIRMTHLKIYRESEILGLAWDGLEMKSVWKIPVAGALADYAVGNVTGQETAQVWVAAVGAGDKTILLAYNIP